MKIKRLTPTAKLPTRGSAGAAGYDLYADDYYTILDHTNTLIHTGISVEIPEGYFGAIYARSGLATKQGLRPANCVGVVDQDYRGEILVSLFNDAGAPKSIEKGERIAQLVIQPYLNVEIEDADDLSDTERGAGGFGSTGVM